MSGFGISFSSATTAVSGSRRSSPSCKWTARDATTGDTGFHAGVAVFIAARSADTGRLFAALSEASPGDWAVRHGGPALEEMRLGARWAGNAPAPTPIGAGQLTLLTPTPAMAPLTRVQLFHSADKGATWTAASELRGVALRSRAPALGATGWAAQAVVLGAGLAGVVVPETPAFAGADFVAWSTAATPGAGDWTAATRAETAEGVVWTLAGLTGAPGAVVTNLRLIWASPTLATASASDARSLTLPQTPAAPAAGDATLTDAAAPSGDRIVFTVATLPASTSPLVRIEHQLSSDGVAWGAAQAGSATLGATELTVLGGAPVHLRWRAVSALGAGGWSPTLSANPTSGVAPGAPIGVTASRLAVVEGQNVHFAPTGLAEAFGVPEREVLEHGDFLYSYSAAPDEDYPFPFMSDDMRCARTAGSSRGQYGHHAYVSADTHRCTLSVTYAGVTKTATVDIAASTADAAYAGAATRVVSAAGDFAGAPSGAAAFTATDVTVHLQWLAGGARRRLLLRRGETFVTAAHINVGAADAYFGAFGGDPEVTPNPVLRRSGEFGTINMLDATLVGDGTTTTFTFAALPALGGGRTKHMVYVGNALQTAGAQYALAADRSSIVFTTAPPAGARIRIFRGPLTVEVRAFLVLRGLRQVVRDIDFRGDYDPAAPTAFDPDDLGTWSVDACVAALNPNDGVGELTILNCRAAGLRSLVEAGGSLDGDNILLSGCQCTAWANYGAFTSQHYRFSLVGCDFRQTLDAVSVADGKTVNKEPAWLNAKGEVVAEGTAGAVYTFFPNHADHGPLRMPRNHQSLLARNRFDSRTTWAGGTEDEAGVQPATRLMQSDQPDQSYAFTENHVSGGSNIGPGGNPPNTDVPRTRVNEIVAAHNVFEWSADTGAVTATGHKFIFRNNLHYIAAAQISTSSDLILFDVNQKIDGFADADAVSGAPEIYNDTFVIKASRPGRDLVLGKAATLQAAGVARIVAQATATEGQSVFVFPRGIPIYSTGSRWRVYVRASAGATWTEIGGAIPTVTGSGTTQTHTVADAWSTVSAGGYDASGTTTLTLAAGRTAGEIVAIVWNPTIGGGGAVWYANNLAAPLMRPAPVVENCAIILEGDFAAVRATPGGALVTAPNYSGAFDAFYRPQAGNSLLTAAATGRRSALDLRGAPKAAGVAGALTTATDLTGWAPLPALPTVSADWATANYISGATVTAADIVPRIEAPGMPVVTEGDLVRTLRVRRGGVELPAAASYTVQTDDLLMGRLRYAHLTRGRTEIALPSRLVLPAAYAPAWIGNAGAAALQMAGTAGPQVAQPLHVALRIRCLTAPAVGVTLWRGVGVSITMSTQRRLSLTSGAMSLASFHDFATQGAEVSLLISLFPGVSGGGTTARITKNGGAPITSTTPTNNPISLNGCTLGGLALSSADKPNVAIRQWFGVWQGGAPSYADFFDPTTHEPLNVAVAPGRGVAGMSALFLFNGVSGLNGPGGDARPLNIGAHVEPGMPARTLAAFAEIV